jgi:hypothetical protein
MGEYGLWVLCFGWSCQPFTFLPCLAKPDIEIWSIFLFYFLFQGRANKYESKDMVARFSMPL